MFDCVLACVCSFVCLSVCWFACVVVFLVAHVVVLFCLGVVDCAFVCGRLFVRAVACLFVWLSVWSRCRLFVCVSVNWFVSFALVVYVRVRALAFVCV